MKLDITKLVLDLKGNTVKDKQKDGSEIDLSLRDLLYLAIIRGDTPKDQLTVVDIISRKKLAQKILSADVELDLKSDEITLLKKLIANLTSTVGFNPVVAGILIEIIEPEEK